MMGYWDEVVHPERLPIEQREAWHRDAWRREQEELLFASQSGYLGSRFEYRLPSVLPSEYPE